jgi:hypothetical protein
MFAVDDLTAGLTLKAQRELLGNSVPVGTDPPCRDNAAIADFHPAAAERPVAILAASEGHPFAELDKESRKAGGWKNGLGTRSLDRANHFLEDIHFAVVRSHLRAVDRQHG